MRNRAGGALPELTIEGPRDRPANQGASVVFICQAVDQDDPGLATTLRWIEALARKPSVGRVTVLALRTGRHDLPEGVEVHRFGRPGRLRRLIAFYREVTRTLRHRPDLFFIFQGGPYPLLLLPFKLFLGIPIVQWKALPVITRAMEIYARCSDLIFTPNRAAFPMALEKVRVVGQHGIDTDLFRIEERPQMGEAIAACRITPRKRVAEMVRAVVRANHTYGTEYRLNVYGPTPPGNEAYAKRIQNLIEELDAASWVTLHGPVLQEELPALLNGHRVFLNFAATAIDKAVLEAMACGLPVVSTNDSVAEALPPDLRSVLITDKHDTERQADVIHELLRRSGSDLASLRQRVRAQALAHGVDPLFDRILAEIRRSLWSRSSPRTG